MKRRTGWILGGLAFGMLFSQTAAAAQIHFTGEACPLLITADLEGTVPYAGAVPQNDYTPDLPAVIAVSESPYSYQDQGYAKLYLQSGGADSPRAVQLRQAKDGKWYLWEQFLLADIRKPESQNPWA